MAEPISGGSLSPWAWAGIGAIAGTVARANDWMDEQGRVRPKMLIADLTSSGFVVIMAVLTADWFHLPGPYAAGLASIGTLVGIRALRDAALKAIEIALAGFARRIGVETPAQQPPPGDEPKT